ncbi:MFS transporter [Oricola cellulosilytica]|uniref:MFS transporter n=1 Tax=Oricola cellulosilytica TaxID=1429082 RepID=A0A4R0PA78_9HYPH|nr:MFS transporter [Oricola cellulosilytica]TCD14150.1 MFS transporter [Oricola cellulosilytica]
MVQLVLPVLGLLASTFLLLAGNGLSGVLLPIRAAIEGWSPFVIGWIGFGYALCFSAGCLVVPRLVLRVGHVRVYAVLASLLAISALLHGLFVNPYAWMVFRGLAGFSLAGTYMIVESWLNEKTSNEARGQMFSIYMVCNMVGLMSGQFLLITSDPGGTALFMIAALLFASAVIPTGLSNASSPKPLTEVSLDLPKLFTNSPLAFVGVAVTGFTFGAYAFQMPVYLQMTGMTEAQIATLMAVAMVGGMVFQYPLGRLSDRMDRRYVILATASAGVLLSILFAAAGATLAVILGLMFLFGGVLMPLYSLVTAYANDHASPDEFVEVSSGLLVVYGAGSMAGPVVAGTVMSTIGASGFFVTTMLCYLAFSLYTVWRMTRRVAVPQEEMTDFTYAPPYAPSQTPESLQLDPRADD